MKKETTKLKLNIKGTFKKFWNRLLLRKKIRDLGVDVHEINDLSDTQIEILVSGEKGKLWDVVKWSKGQDVFILLNEVIFEFADSPKL